MTPSKACFIALKTAPEGHIRIWQECGETKVGAARSELMNTTPTKGELNGLLLKHVDHARCMAYPTAVCAFAG
ncbi:MAG: hypothetical protein ACXV7G_12785 [Halobacteriota archaeon]